jgi:hypothetical protein
MSAAVIECPICMDTIETTRNCTTTDCGHCFHTKCLMTSVAHNGFGCPYCRTRMADEVAEEDSDYDDNEEEEIYEPYDDDVLRGFRLFNNNINGEEHDEDDVEEENFVNQEEEEEESEAVAEDNAPPPVSYVAQKLVEQGVTMEQLLKAVLCSCNDYERDYEDFERVESEIVGRVTTILNNYTPATTPPPVTTPPVTTHPVTTTTTDVWTEWM